MKVYVYEKKDKHKRYQTINNVREIKETKRMFLIETTECEEYCYQKEYFMLSVYGY